MGFMSHRTSASNRPGSVAPTTPRPDRTRPAREKSIPRRAARPRIGAASPASFGIRLAYVMKIIGRRPWPSGLRGLRNLRISRARPRRPGGNTASRDQSAADRRQGTKVERKESAVGEIATAAGRAAAPRGDATPRPRVPRRPREKGGPAMKDPRTTEIEPVRDVRRSLAECRLLPGLRPFLLLLGLLHCGTSRSTRCGPGGPRPTRATPGATRGQTRRASRRSPAERGRDSRGRPSTRRIVGEPEPRGEFVGPEAPGSEEANRSPP